MESEKVEDKKTMAQMIVNYLSLHQESSIKDLSKYTGRKSDSVSVIVNRLKKNGYLKNVGFGRYSLEEGQPSVDNITLSHKRIEKALKITSPIQPNEDVLIDEFMRLKAIYGREKLLKVLPKWQRILE